MYFFDALASVLIDAFPSIRQHPKLDLIDSSSDIYEMMLSTYMNDKVNSPSESVLSDLEEDTQDA